MNEPRPSSPPSAPLAERFALAFGEALWDRLPTGAMLGGAPTNFSYRLQSLGVPVVLVTKVGIDPEGMEAIRRLEELGVSTEFIQRDPALPTGTVDVRLSSAGDGSYVINKNVAYDAIDPTAELLERAQSAALVCFGTLAQREERSRKTAALVLEAAESSVKLLDINLRKGCYSNVTIESSLERADILKLNGDEAKELSRMLWGGEFGHEEFCARIIDRYRLKSCLVTLADQGVVALGDGESVIVEGHQVAVVDTIGSGDAFTAGFAYRLLAGDSLRDCCEYGNALGALVATTKGATTPVSRDSVDRFRRRASVLA